MEDEDCQFVAETLAWRGRCNDGSSRKEAINMIIDIQPELTRKQSSRQFSRIILSRAHTKEIIKKTLQKVQSTTYDRITITLPQQYRWHVAAENEYEFLRENNFGLVKNQGNLLEDDRHTLLLDLMRCAS